MPDEQSKASGVPVGLLRTYNTCLCYVAGATEFATFPGCLGMSLFIEVYLAGLMLHGRHIGQCCRSSPEEAGGRGQSPLPGQPLRPELSLSKGWELNGGGS